MVTEAVGSEWGIPPTTVGQSRSRLRASQLVEQMCCKHRPRTIPTLAQRRNVEQSDLLSHTVRRTSGQCWEAEGGGEGRRRTRGATTAQASGSDLAVLASRPTWCLGVSFGVESAIPSALFVGELRSSKVHEATRRTTGWSFQLEELMDAS